MEKIDADLMYEQIVTFTKVVTAIDYAKTEELGTVEPSSFSLLGLFVKEE
ncbi:hypothetical protein [Paenibacillus durus]|nr:hypothetical protein [Paenibacillus durus]